jgi:hypothetical protein
MANTVTAAQLQNSLTGQFQGVRGKTSEMFGTLLSQATNAYERRWHEKMPIAKQQMLMQAFQYFGEHPPVPGASREMILSAAQDVHKVDNPLAFMMAMMSIIIPNFAYTEVVGIQNMPTKESSIFVPQISATQDRNGFVAGQSLLGATNWAVADNYTTNQLQVAATTATSTTLALAPAAINAGIVPGSVIVTGNGYTVGPITTPISFQDNAKGGFLPDPYLQSGTINYATGEIQITLQGLTGGTGGTVFLTLDPDIIAGQHTIDGPNTPPYGRQSPSQVTLEWNTVPCVAVPYRVRSAYSLENYYAAKQVLAGYDIDQVMATSLAGLINKEISHQVFTKMLNESDALYSWDSTPPTGVSWAIHRLSMLALMVSAKNGIRQNIQRSGGNVAVVGTGLINQIETLDNTIYTPQKYSAEPIGPYVHGTFSNGIKVIKHQAAGWESRGVMGYKSNDTDASMMGGSYIALYSTPALVLDTGAAVQGMGCQAGFVKVFQNSIVELGITGNWQGP